MNVSSIPKSTLGRIPVYIQYLKEVSEDGISTISATKIARGLSLGEVQVRKDLALISGRGKPKIGYEKIKLMQDLESHLGYENSTNAVLIGAGKLGRALLDYDGFENYGVKIVAGFDCNETVLKRGAKDILPIKDIGAYCREHDVRLGIITVGRGSAQEACDKLVESGIEAIWNFAPVTLKVPEGVLLKQENLALSLAYLNNQMSK